MKIETVGPILKAVTPWLGRPLSFSTLGKHLGVSHRSAKARVLTLAESDLLWLLYPIPTEPRSRVRKAPKPYIFRPELIRLAERLTANALTADSAAEAAQAADAPTATVQAAPATQAPEAAPAAKASSPQACPAAAPEEERRRELELRTRMIRIIRQKETERQPSSRFWYYGGYGDTHVELIVETEAARIGFVFLPDKIPSRWGWSYCRRVLAAGVIQGGFILYPGRRAFFAARCLVALPASEFLNHYPQWMAACLEGSQEKLQKRVRAYNGSQSQPRQIRIDRERRAD